MAYLIRRLLENTANSSFLRQNLAEKSVEDLISPPKLPLTPSSKAGEDFHALFQNSADTDYADEELRTKSQQALKEVSNSLGKTYLPLINGEYVETTEYISSVNPSRERELIGKIGLISVEQAEQALQAAKSAFTLWKNTPAVERANILQKAADIMKTAQ